MNKTQSLIQRGFRVIRTIGKGAFSQVLLVQQMETDIFFACKISERKDLAQWEGRLLASTDHPLFPGFCDLWEENENSFLLMEYICGSSLEELLQRRGSFAQTQTARVGMELAEGLRYLHQLPEPVLYRDVKPNNVMIRQDGRVKLLDMGCACRLRYCVSARAGTPGYAAPEQLEEGGVLSFACDVYGLGRTLEAMAGKNCGDKLGAVIAACTAKNPKQRIPDMQGVMTALAPLCREGKGRERLAGIQGFLQPRVACVENIWENEYKNI